MCRINWASPALAILMMTVAGLSPRVATAQDAASARTASAYGKAVRITAIDGSEQTGRLVSLSDSDVVFRRHSNDISIPLGGVRSIEKVSHSLRNGALIGLGVGVVLGVTPGYNAYRGDLGYELGTLVDGGVFAGIGAGIGLLVGLAKASDNLLYLAPGSSSSITLTPRLSPRQQSLALALRW